MKIYFIFCLFVLCSCKVDPEIIQPSEELDSVKEIIPEGWPNPYYTFLNNKITPEIFLLGKALFYEPILSSNNSISCGSCHIQASAFAHSEHEVSHGVNGLLGTRNAPALQNLNWNSSFMHDGGILNIELQAAGPITNPIEMNETLSNVLLKISNSSKYNQLFAKAYGDQTVTTERLFKALTQFMGTMYSYNSKYDKVKLGKETFTQGEQNGYVLFKQKCESCHKEPLFSDYEFRNNGLKINALINDSGRAQITGLPSDKYKFKTPSLRNIERTEPYMHDGSLQTLDDCLNHYTSNIINTINLAPQLQTSISLTVQEKSDLILFLKTLTDEQFLNDKRYAE